MADTKDTTKPKVLEKRAVEFVTNTEKPETKNCWRFEEVLVPKKPKVIGQLYLQKTAFKGTPEHIRVTVEVLE